MRKTELQINLKSIKDNLNQIKNYTSAKIQAVVKAGAYGLSLDEVYNAISNDVESFAVITLKEAKALRQITDKPILLIQGVHETKDYSDAEDLNLDFAIHSPWQFDGMKKFNLSNSRIWLKIETGMNRFGLHEQDFLKIYKSLNKEKFAEIILMSHLACSGDKNNEFNQNQIDNFKRITHNMPERKSLGNSGAIFNFPDAHFDIVRPGIALYGGKYLEFGIKPTTKLRSKIISIKDVKKGASVGYDMAWTAVKDTKIGIIGIGYGDGFPYVHNPLSVSINNKTFKTVGRINMDAITIDLDGDELIKMGDWVELWGFNTDLTSFSSEFGSISYRLLTNISGRVDKNYLE